MKLPADVVEVMRQRIAERDTAEVRAAYRAGDYPRSEATRDVDKRYRWDLLHATHRAAEVCELYDRHDVNDSHIDTALRAIVPPL